LRYSRWNLIWNPRWFSPIFWYPPNIGICLSLYESIISLKSNTRTRWFETMFFQQFCGGTKVEILTKFSDKLNMKINFLNIGEGGLLTWTMYKNLTFFLKFWSNFGYCKSEKKSWFKHYQFLL
jgi:hypothetical protein